MRSKNFITCSVLLYRVKCGPKIVSHVPYYCRVKCGPKISLGNWLALLSANYGMSGLNVAGGKFWDIAVHPPRRTCIYSLSKLSEKQIWGPCVKDIQGWEERQGGSPSLSLCVYIRPLRRDSWSSLNVYLRPLRWDSWSSLKYLPSFKI